MDKILLRNQRAKLFRVFVSLYHFRFQSRLLHVALCRGAWGRGVDPEAGRSVIKCSRSLSDLGTVPYPLGVCFTCKISRVIQTRRPARGSPHALSHLRHSSPPPGPLRRREMAGVVPPGLRPGAALLSAGSSMSLLLPCVHIPPGCALHFYHFP